MVNNCLRATEARRWARLALLTAASKRDATAANVKKPYQALWNNNKRKLGVST